MVNRPQSSVVRTMLWRQQGAADPRIVAEVSCSSLHLHSLSQPLGERDEIRLKQKWEPEDRRLCEAGAPQCAMSVVMSFNPKKSS